MSQSRHFDAEYQSYYWHNAGTGQSVWDEDEGRTEEEGSQHRSPPNERVSYKHQQPRRGDLKYSNNRDPRFSDTRSRSRKNDQNGSDPRSHGSEHHSRIAVKTSRNDSSHKESDDEDDEDGENDSSTLLQNKEKTEKTEKNKLESFEITIPPQRNLVNAQTSRAIWAYSICMFLNAIVVEGPFSALEGILRGMFFFISSIFVLFSAVLFFHRRHYFFNFSYQLLREALLCGAAAVTLSIPGAACIVYRQYVLDGDWDLSTIPTVLGWVDSRRFYSFSYGNGSFASNVRYDTRTDRQVSQDYDKFKGQSGKQQQWSTLDTWKSNDFILLEPRRLQYNVIRIVRGEDPLGILHPINNVPSELI